MRYVPTPDTSEGREIPEESWDCPFCQRAVSAKTIEHLQSSPPREGARTLRVRIRFMPCPNRRCREVSIRAYLYNRRTPRPVPGLRGLSSKERNVLPDEFPIETWLRPTALDSKVFPAYIPEAIRWDYTEACLIRTLSPKASATLSRRCLQGMIRNFWEVKKKRNLKQEIDAIKNKVDPQVWAAIDSLREIGNIGAHMEKDVNLIIDVDPEEASKLIKLNELLFEEWYINREERRKLVQEVADIGKQKQAAKKSGNKPAADA